MKLWYANVDYQLRLGHLVSIWTPHISNAESSSLTLQDASLVTSVFPERDNSCYFMVQENSDEDVLCKSPLGYRDGKQLNGLITLKGYIDGGHEVPGVRVLVCVKSIGGRKKCESIVLLTESFQNNAPAVTTKKGVQTEKIDINIFDDTADATLTLWARTATSASRWKPSYTILLITNPSFKGDRRPTLSLNQGTHVDLDPCMDDAYWLRGHAQKLTKREHVNEPFPDGGVRLSYHTMALRLIWTVFDIEAIAEANVKILFTLADLDEL